MRTLVTDGTCFILLLLLMTTCTTSAFTTHSLYDHC